jgi:hypothetical protein
MDSDPDDLLDCCEAGDDEAVSDADLPFVVLAGGLTGPEAEERIQVYRELFDA